MRIVTHIAVAVAANLLILLVALATLGAGIGIAGQALGQECYNQAGIERDMATRAAHVVHEFVGDDAQAWLDLFNAVPPPTDIRGERVVIAEGLTRAFIYIETGGCFPAEVWHLSIGNARRLADAVLGEGV